MSDHFQDNGPPLEEQTQTQTQNQSQNPPGPLSDTVPKTEPEEADAAAVPETEPVTQNPVHSLQSHVSVAASQATEIPFAPVSATPSQDFQTSASSSLPLQLPLAEASSPANQAAIAKPASDVLAHYAQHGHPECKFYPNARARQADVVSSRTLFLQTLEEFHSHTNTKFMIPIIGGKELDLHLLYKEVTSRGGINQVIKDRKWKEITAAFNFPSTATNASYVVRRYYLSLLYHYEQVYFHGAQGQPILPPVATQVVSPFHPKPVAESSNTEEVRRKRRKKTLLPVSKGDPTSVISQPVTGVIDGKLDSAYLVTVTVGSEKLKGVLYQMPSGFCGEQFAQVYDHIGVPNNGQSVSEVRTRRRRRKKSEMRRRDPDHPKPNRSGYNFFFQEQHAKLKLLHPGKDREISKMIGDSWNNLTEEEKAVYQERGQKDKERYKSEMLEYRERQRIHSQEKDPSVTRTVESNEVGTCMKTEFNHGITKGLVLDNSTLPAASQQQSVFLQGRNNDTPVVLEKEVSNIQDTHIDSSPKYDSAKDACAAAVKPDAATIGISTQQENSNRDFESPTPPT